MRRVLARAARRLRGPDRRGVIPLEEIARHLPADAVVVEAGAHRGVDTVAMARAWPSATIHAFEPVPELFAQLVRATAGMQRVHPFELALGDRRGRAQMFLSAGGSDGSSSLAAPKVVLETHPDVAFDDRMDVDVVDLDGWAADHGVSRVDFLWLDAQGYELAILGAAARLLPAVSAIHAEVHLNEDYEGTPTYDEFRSWLAGRGFEPAVERLDWFDGGNVLFVNQAIARGAVPRTT